MSAIALSKVLREEYQRLFDTCVIREDKFAEVERILSRIDENRHRYLTVGEALGIPWPFIAVIHNMEASLRFDRHLHNGDPLTGFTVHVPKNRPKNGHPPFTWEQSAIDALQFKQLDRWEDWSVPGMLYKLEQYNGWGYRNQHPEVLSPYLWSSSYHYTSGKYVADGRWSDVAVSKQVGAAVLLRRMAEKGEVRFDDSAAVVAEDARPLICYSTTEKSIHVENLQKFLNTLPGSYVGVDGYLGDKTSDALKQVFGFHAFGDPRDQS